MSKIKVNEISKHDASEITINDTIKVDTIAEKTSAAGVTIDGVLIKDGQVDGVDVSTLSVDTNNLVKLASTTASNDDAIIFDNFVDHNTYINYFIVIKDLHPENDNVELRLKFRVGGASGSNGSDTYRSGGYYVYANTSSSGFFTNNNATDYHRIANAVGNADNEVINANATFFPSTGTAASSGASVFNSRHTQQNEMSQLQIVERSIFAYVTATGLNFYYSSGQIVSGEIVVYGIKK